LKFKLRNNSLLVVSVLAYILVVAVVLIVIDVQFYQNAKRFLMLSEDYPDYPPRIEKLTPAMGRLMEDEGARAILASPNLNETLRQSAQEEIRLWQEDTGATMTAAQIARETEFLVGHYRESLPKLVLEKAARKELEKEVDKGLRDLLDSYPSLISLQLVYDKTTLMEIRPPVPRRLDTWRNSLILKGFLMHSRQGFSFVKLPMAERNRASILFMYGSPAGFAPLEELTRTYWAYIALSVLAITLAYRLTLRFILLPIKTVTEAIQSAHDRPGEFVRNPHTRLERLYNTMARDALLNDLASGLAGAQTRGLRLTPRDLFAFLAPRIADWFDFDGVWVLDLAWQGRELLVPEGQTPEDRAGELSTWDSIGPAFDPALARNLRTSWESSTPQMYTCPLPGGKGHVFVGVLGGGQSTEEVLRVFVLFKRKIAGGEALTWHQDSAERLYRRVDEMFERQLLQSRELMREKSEANINLSRNLGHDLTNIIATNKLELMTIGQILRGDTDAWMVSSDKAQIVRDCMGRILDNTRSLQEIVNLYRAYEYLKSPRYETVDFPSLLREIIEIFQLSMSAAADISVDCPEAMPGIQAEPRLIKLALFNLLSNAQDAIRRLPPAEQAAGRILVQTFVDRAKNRIVARVSDTGAGIRTPDGQLAGKDEIRRVFELGYTTKTGGGGEGLGLNWVKTILTEFHTGELLAYNRPEGGATFEFSLRIGDGVS